MNCVCFNLVQWPQRDGGDMGCEDILACVNLDAAPWRCETWTIIRPQCYERISWYALTLLQHHDRARPDPSCVHSSPGGQWAGCEGPGPWGVGHLHPPSPLAHRATTFLRLHPLWSVYCSVAWLCVRVRWVDVHARVRAYALVGEWAKSRAGVGRLHPHSPQSHQHPVTALFSFCCGLCLALWWSVGAWPGIWVDCGFCVMTVRYWYCMLILLPRRVHLFKYYIWVLLVSCVEEWVDGLVTGFLDCNILHRVTSVPV